MSYCSELETMTRESEFIASIDAEGKEKKTQKHKEKKTQTRQNRFNFFFDNIKTPKWLKSTP